MTYTAGSLFTGIGGLDLAFSAAGFDVRFQVEIDSYCRRVLERHAPTYWPNAKLHEDVTRVGCEQLETVDVLFGGFPCQDISLAGKRAGIAVGTRSGLWFEFVRIIGELRPRILLLENVANINVLGGTTVIGDLAEIGYDALWFSLRASDAGAPHRRERWFCVAYAQHIRRDSTPVERGNGETVCDSAQGADGSSKFARVYTPPPLAYAESEQCGERRPQPETQQRGSGAVGVGAAVQESADKGTLAYAGGMGCDPAREVQARSCRNGNGCAETPAQRRQHVAHVARRKRGGARSIERRRSYGTGQLESGLDRTADGLSDWMDFPGWPAGPGHEQYAYEPPRVTKNAPNRMARIKALGNAVVPQVVFPIAVAVRAFLEAQDAAPARPVEGEAAA